MVWYLLPNVLKHFVFSDGLISSCERAYTAPTSSVRKIAARWCAVPVHRKFVSFHILSTIIYCYDGDGDGDDAAQTSKLVSQRARVVWGNGVFYVLKLCPKNCVYESINDNVGRRWRASVDTTLCLSLSLDSFTFVCLWSVGIHIVLHMIIPPRYEHVYRWKVDDKRSSFNNDIIVYYGHSHPFRPISRSTVRGSGCYCNADTVRNNNNNNKVIVTWVHMMCVSFVHRHPLMHSLFHNYHQV